MESRVARVRELNGEITRLKAENARLHDENAALRGHFDLALLAALDLRELGQSGRLVIIDGWNLILGNPRAAADPQDLRAQMEKYLAAHPDDFVWVIYDGPKMNSLREGRMRTTYTGGSGQHRADRLVCDYLRMAKYSGDISRIEVRTNDKDFRKAVSAIASGV